MKTGKSRRDNAGLSLPEVLISSFILVLVVFNSVRMTTNALSGMGRSKSRTLIDASVARKIETLRKRSFDFLCTQGCSNDELTKALKYDLSSLKPLCETKRLGQAFLNNLSATDKPETFIVATIPPVTVNVTYTAEQNHLNISYSASTKPELALSTTLVPHAQGWCP